MSSNQGGEYEPGAFSGNPEFVWRTALLQGAGMLGASGQFHCYQELRRLNDLIVEIATRRGLNPRDACGVVQHLDERCA